MGLSSSQARLLNLTARMHQIEYKAARLEAQKLQMANESRRVYEDYLDALDASKVQKKFLNADGSIGYIDATYNNLIAAGYKITIIDSSAVSLDSRLLKPITQVTDSANIPSGYTAIYTASDLRNINNNPSGKYILMNDIDLSGTTWYSLCGSEDGAFSGVLNGNGHVIKNMNAVSNEGIFAGLFAFVNGGKISNLGVENATVTGACVAVIVSNACDSYAEISNCYAEGKVDGYQTAGIAAYRTSNVIIKDCYSNVEMDVYSLGDYLGANNNAQNCYYVNTHAVTSEYTGSHPIGAMSGTEATAEDITSMIIAGRDDLDFKNSTEWLTNMINEGAIILSKPDDNGNFFETSVATDTGLQEVSDETLLKKAEAKYEADMKRIDLKDRKFDTDLAALDAERNAIKQEIETLKTVAKDNVERTFKLFS